MLFKEVSEQIARDLNLPVYIVDRVMRSHFKMFRNTMEAGELKGIMFPNLGKFLVRTKRQESLKRRKLDGQTIHIQDNEDIDEGDEE